MIRETFIYSFLLQILSRSGNANSPLLTEARFALFCASRSDIMNRSIKDSAPLVKLLIQRSANIYAPLSDRETLVHYVFEHCEYEILLAFLDCADNITFDSKDQQGCTVLHAACKWQEVLPGYRHKHWDSKPQAPLLSIVDLGADLLAVDNDGRNALHHLLDNPEIEDDTILQVLGYEKVKKLVGQLDSQGFHPHHYALKTFRPTVCEKLMKMGVDLLSPDPTGATPLHHIAQQCLQSRRAHREYYIGPDDNGEFQSGCLRLWQNFLDLGCDINARDSSGAPPLFRYLSSPRNANGNGSSHIDDLSKFFATAHTTLCNAKRENALHVIVRRQGGDSKYEGELFQFMVSKGLDPLAEDGRGRSSLDVAAACGKKQILDLFQYTS